MNTTAKAHIAFIGLGAMGMPMARNLVDAGYDVRGHARSAATRDGFESHGGRAASTIQDAVGGADVIVTMLPDTSAVESVADEIVQAAKDGAIWVDMSSISPAGARRVAEKAVAAGVRALDAPVSGGTKGATEGTLSIMVGGEKEVLEAAMPVLDVLGARIVHVGSNGAGQIAKAANQMIVAGTLAVVAEALELAERAMGDAAIVREAMLGGFADSPILRTHGQRMLDGAFAPGFRSRLQDKDLRIALEVGQDAGLPMPVTTVVERLYADLSETEGELDHSAVINVYRRPAR